MAMDRNEIWCWACAHCDQSGTVAAATGDPIWKIRELVEAIHLEGCGGFAAISRTTIYVGFNEFKPPTETYVWYCPTCRCSGFVDAVDHRDADRKAAAAHDDEPRLPSYPICHDVVHVLRAQRKPKGVTAQ